MSSFTHQHGRLTIFFSDHALDRWWERCQANGGHGRQQAMDLLRNKLNEIAANPQKHLERTAPPWSHLSLWHQARAENYLMLASDSCFVINRNETGDLVAVTYIEPEGRNY